MDKKESVPTETDHVVSVIGLQGSSICSIWWNLQNYFDLKPNTPYYLPANSPTRELYCPGIPHIEIRGLYMLLVLTTKVRVRNVTFSLIDVPVTVPSFMTGVRGSFIKVAGTLRRTGKYAGSVLRTRIEDHLRQVPKSNLIIMVEATLDDLDLVRPDEGLTTFSSSSNLSQDLEDLLVYQIFSDVQLVKGGAGFGVHKCIMAARSGVFKRALDTLEPVVDLQQLLPEHLLNVPDEAIKRVLMYAYTGMAFDLVPEMAVPMYLVAKALEMPDLQNVCAMCFSRNITVSSFLGVLNLALFTKNEDLALNLSFFYVENKEEIKKLIFSEDGQTLLAPAWITPQERVVLERRIRQVDSHLSSGQADKDTPL